MHTHWYKTKNTQTNKTKKQSGKHTQQEHIDITTNSKPTQTKIHKHRHQSKPIYTHKTLYTFTIPHIQRITHKHKHTHPYTQKHKQKKTKKHIQTPSPHTNTDTYIYTYKKTQTQVHTRVHTCEHTLKHKHTHT